VKKSRVSQGEADGQNQRVKDKEFDGRKNHWVDVSESVTGEECGQFQADALSLGAAPDSHGRYFLK
jgi:hypothetical protein